MNSEIIADETREVHKSNRLQMFFNIGILKKYFLIFTRKESIEDITRKTSSKLRNSVFVDKKFYALQLKQKSTAGTFHGISRNFRAANFDYNFGGCF